MEIHVSSSNVAPVAGVGSYGVLQGDGMAEYKRLYLLHQ